VSPSLTQWQQRRTQLVTILERLAEMAHQRGDQTDAQARRAASARLAEGRLTLAVLGEFKRGKSTLINSLLGAEVMPVGVIPMTSVPLLVQYGDEYQVMVELVSGECVQVDPTALSAYATETGNPGNARGVARVLIQHPAQILSSGVILVDTPGIGSIHAHNTQAAYELLAQADAALFVLSVDSPASRAELDFLAAARGQISRLLFALNKADLLNAEELQEATGFVRSVFEQVAPGEGAAVYAISARSRDEGFQQLESALERFLVQERGRFLLQRAEDVAAGAVRQERQALQLERAALAISAEEADRRIAVLEGRLHEITRQRLEAEEVLAGDIRRLVAGSLDPAIHRFRQLGETRVQAAVEEEIRQGPRDLRPRLERSLAAVITEEVGRFVPELEAELAAGMEETARRHADRTNALITAAVKVISEVFEVTLEELSLGTELRPRSRRLILIKVEDLALERLSSALKGLVPGSAGIGLARRDALSRGEELVDRHCGRLRHDALERVRSQEQEWRRQLATALESLEATVRRAVGAAAAGRSNGMGRQEDLLQLLDRRARRIEELEIGIRSHE
jgi:ribosome biogenesis GTPase A